LSVSIIIQMMLIFWRDSTYSGKYQCLI